MTRRLPRSVIVMLAAAAVLAAVLASVRPIDAAEAQDLEVEFWLTINHNNDGESELLAAEVLDENGTVIGFQGGVAYFASVLGDARTAANQKPRGDNTKRGSIFVSSGDNFLASPSFSASVADGVFYDALALDALRYDAIVLGNHDFDFGPEVLAEFIGEGFARPGKPPYVSANLDFTGEPALQALVDDGVIAASTVVDVKGEHVGVVGATTPNLPFISSPRNVVVESVLPVAQEAIDDLTAAGVDKIVFVSHLQDIEGDIELAGLLEDVDVMVAGGGDELLASPGDPLLPSDSPADVYDVYPIIGTNGDGNDIPIVTTTGQYGYLGNLVVGFDDDGEVVAVDDEASLPLRVVSESIGPDGVRPNGALAARVVRPVEAFVADLDATVIATSEVDLDGRRNFVRSQATNEGNLIGDALLWQANALAADFGVEPADLAIQNGGGIRNDSIIPAGDITELDTFDMLPFPNFVTISEDLSRERVKELLEHAVSCAVGGDPAYGGADSCGSGRFAQVGGIEFTWDATGTQQQLDELGVVTQPGTRVVEATLADGTPIVVDGAVVPGPVLRVATIDFLARGGDQYPYRDTAFTVLGASYQQALSNYLQAAVADGGLGGLITADDYPEGGGDRIVRLN